MIKVRLTASDDEWQTWQEQRYTSREIENGVALNVLKRDGTVMASVFIEKVRDHEEVPSS